MVSVASAIALAGCMSIKTRVTPLSISPVSALVIFACQPGPCDSIVMCLPDVDIDNMLQFPALIQPRYPLSYPLFRCLIHWSKAYAYQASYQTVCGVAFSQYFKGASKVNDRRECYRQRAVVVEYGADSGGFRNVQPHQAYFVHLTTSLLFQIAIQCLHSSEIPRLSACPCVTADTMPAEASPETTETYRSRNQQWRCKRQSAYPVSRRYPFHSSPVYVLIVGKPAVHH